MHGPYGRNLGGVSESNGHRELDTLALGSGADFRQIHALNRAVPLVENGILAFVDDDHRVDEDYLVEIYKASRAYSHAGLICGRILADWDGREPAWVHDTGPYRIYPLPVPLYDEGDQPKEITERSGAGRRKSLRAP